jgi:isocitrate/isopropylmalate dehydrogenase
MRHTESETGPGDRKPLSGSADRQMKAGAPGEVSWDIAVLPGNGIGPDIAGKGIASPVATILSGAMMLEWLGHPELCVGAARIRRAVETVLANPANRTPDTGGRLSIQQITEKITEQL